MKAGNFGITARIWILGPLLAFASSAPALADPPLEPGYDVYLLAQAKVLFMQSEAYKKHGCVAVNDAQGIQHILCRTKPDGEAGVNAHPCRAEDDPFGVIRRAADDVHPISEDIAGIPHPVAASSASLTLPTAGFPLNNSDAYVGPKGYMDVISVATVSRSGNSRDFSGPYTEIMYNPADNLQINAATGGALADRTDGVSTVAAGDATLGAKYTFYHNAEKGLTAAVGAQVTSNVGRRAVDAGLANEGPVVGAMFYGSKTIGDRATLSVNLMKTSGPHGTGEWDYGPVLAHQISDKTTAFLEMDGRRSDLSGDSALSAALGIAYTINAHFSAGVGISHSVSTSGPTYTPGSAMMVGISWNN